MRLATLIACAAVCCCLLGHGAARAQRYDHDDAPRRRRGTHFIVDMAAGVTPGAGAGFAGALAFGAGGRPRGTPTRLYGLAELSFARRQPDPALHAPSIERDERDYVGLAGGVRLYIPVSSGLRLHVDALGGASYNSAELTTAAAVLAEQDWFVQGALAAGAQYRFLRELSVGARLKWIASSDPLRELRQTLGLSDGFPFVLTAGLTWHF